MSDVSLPPSRWTIEVLTRPPLWVAVGHRGTDLFVAASFDEADVRRKAYRQVVERSVRSLRGPTEDTLRSPTGERPGPQAVLPDASVSGRTFPGDSPSDEAGTPP